ncbi:helix-turn-helix domain-containing protein [Actinocorallia sp. API 0066]|uniref:helix-turn-helix domain-containing protein n=1 Tax=Actinocorallia sp. API 0066 TaxID=2896846 RepID=UPI001E49264E|nr:helix-turn-helix transcriptional regulator [Actinocorallia sp. API 0066]MCD0450444.1 helix-turn-helix domain-containing protein [Actinocorallia sp. API 0066]
MLEPEQLGQQKNELALYLRDLRRQAGLTGDRLSVRCGISQSKISKIETGRVLPSLMDVERILGALNAPADVVEKVVSLARLANTEFSGLRSSLRRGLHHRQSELASIEAGASNIRFFLPTMITGLLHTPEYAKASLATIPGDHSKAIARRLERQSILYDQSKRFVFVLTEAALRWPLCEPSVMMVQLGRIATLAALPNIEVRVISFGQTLLPEGPLNTFTVYDESLATAETFGGAVVMRDPRDVSYHLELFSTFEGYALSPEDSRGFLIALQEKFIP